MEDTTPKRRLGRPPGSTTGVPKETIHITVPRDLAEWLRTHDRGVSAVVTKALEDMRRAQAS